MDRASMVSTNGTSIYSSVQKFTFSAVGELAIRARRALAPLAGSLLSGHPPPPLHYFLPSHLLHRRRQCQGGEHYLAVAKETRL